MAQHHSVDRGHQEKLRAMERMAKDPLKCKTCRRLNKVSAGFCGACGFPWAQCWDRNYNHAASRNYAEDNGQSSNWQKWDLEWAQNWDQRPRSPRRRSSKSPRTTRKGDGKSGKGGGKGNSGQNPKWPAPVLDYTKIKDNKKPEVVPPRIMPPKPTEPSTEVQDLLAALQSNYPDGLPQEVQAKVDRLKRSTTTDLRKHIGQLTKVKKDLEAMREARLRHMAAWKRHVVSLVENTKVQLQQYNSVLDDFETCEAELVQTFDQARKAILEITQQTKPAEEDVMAIKEVDSGLLAGGADAPIDVDREEDQENTNQSGMDLDDMNKLQSSLAECIASISEGKKSRARDAEAGLGGEEPALKVSRQGS